MLSQNSFCDLKFMIFALIFLEEGSLDPLSSSLFLPQTGLPFWLSLFLWRVLPLANKSYIPWPPFQPCPSWDVSLVLSGPSDPWVGLLQNFSGECTAPCRPEALTPLPCFESPNLGPLASRALCSSDLRIPPRRTTLSQPSQCASP